MRFKQHVEKYAGLAVIAERAVCFLGVVERAHNTKEMVKSYRGIFLIHKAILSIYWLER
jgi:hypothetical protein